MGGIDIGNLHACILVGLPSVPYLPYIMELVPHSYFPYTTTTEQVPFDPGKILMFRIDTR